MPGKRFVNIHVTKILNSGIIIPFVDKIMYQVWGPNNTTFKCYHVSYISTKSRSQGSRDLWRGTADARLLGIADSSPAGSMDVCLV